MSRSCRLNLRVPPPPAKLEVRLWQVAGVSQKRSNTCGWQLLPTDNAPIEDRAVSEAEEAVLNLVRAMGEGDIVEGLGKLEMLLALDVASGTFSPMGLADRLS